MCSFGTLGRRSFCITLCITKHITPVSQLQRKPAEILEFWHLLRTDSNPILSAIFALPGSEDAVRLALDKLILPEIGHVVRELHR